MTGGYFSGGEGSDDEDTNSDSTDTKSNADSDAESDTEFNEVEGDGDGEGEVVKPAADEEEADGDNKDDDASDYSDAESDTNEAEEDEDGDGDDEDAAKITKSVNTKAIKPVDIYTNLGDENEEDDDEEDEDENYLQKFDADVNKNYIMDFHPECVISNYDEIATLTVVTRDNYNIIIDDLHRTAPYLSKYERARILGQRAKQINSGAQAFVKVPEKVMDGYLIAELELLQKTIPFIIRRPLPNGGSEYWKLTDLENISF